MLKKGLLDKKKKKKKKRKLSTSHDGYGNSERQSIVHHLEHIEAQHKRRLKRKIQIKVQEQ